MDHELVDAAGELYKNYLREYKNSVFNNYNEFYFKVCKKLENKYSAETIKRFSYLAFKKK